MYVDRGDGSPLRRRDWSPDDPLAGQPDPTLQSGRCVMAHEVLEACPHCGMSKDAMPASAWDFTWRTEKVDGRQGSGSCGPDCLEATSTKCRCSCGGANHGMGMP